MHFHFLFHTKIPYISLYIHKHLYKHMLYMEKTNSHEGDENVLKENETRVVERVMISPPTTSVTSNNSYMGKHRLTAAIAQLDHQIKFIQEELDELETLGQSSLVCKELVTAVESIPDPLLPEIGGPAIVSWDRWFQGGSRARKRWY